MQFFQSLSLEQWSLFVGGIFFVLHYILDQYKLTKKLTDTQRTKINYMITRVVSVVTPVLVAVATDPNISAIVHNYFPAFVGFFVAYQGLYLSAGRFLKWASAANTALKMVNAVAPVEGTI